MLPLGSVHVPVKRPRVILSLALFMYEAVKSVLPVLVVRSLTVCWEGEGGRSGMDVYRRQRESKRNPHPTHIHANRQQTEVSHARWNWAVAAAATTARTMKMLRSMVPDAGGRHGLGLDLFVCGCVWTEEDGSESRGWVGRQASIDLRRWRRGRVNRSIDWSMCRAAPFINQLVNCSICRFIDWLIGWSNSSIQVPTIDPAPRLELRRHACSRSRSIETRGVARRPTCMDC